MDFQIFSILFSFVSSIFLFFWGRFFDNINNRTIYENSAFLTFFIGWIALIHYLS